MMESQFFQQSLDPVHELTKTYLFLRTAHTAVANLSPLVASAKAYGQQWNSMHFTDGELTTYTTRLEEQERDLRVWTGRLDEAQVGLVDWAARRELERALLEEILDIVRTMLRKGERELSDLWCGRCRA